MATDDPETDDENEERTGPDARHSPEVPGTYANAGRERGTKTRQQAWDAPRTPDDTARTPDDTVPENAAPTDRRQSERPQEKRRQSERSSGNEGETSRPSRRYGSRPPSGGGDRSGDSVWVEEQGRTEQTPPKRTQPLREPTPSEESNRESETGRDRGPEVTDREPESGTESAERSDVPKYGGPRGSARERSRSRSVERQRTQREYERRFDSAQARQRDFQRDKSGGKYRRR
jgi:hypothetical protein